MATPNIPDISHGYFPGLQRPNATQVNIRRDDGPIILIVVDALRPDRMSPYGFERDTTPNLAKLADEGVLLTNYYVNGNWTRPTTASMLTGLPPASHGAERERDKLADEFVTLAELLSDVGVPTGAVVGNGNAGSAFGLSRGFQFYADTVKHWRGLPSAEQVTELAVPFVNKHKDDPFFLMLFFIDPHDPYKAPGDYEDMYVEDSSVPLVRTPHWELGKYSQEQIERMKATYDGAVRYTDDTLGKFFKHLKDIGIYDKATIIVTSDHGEAFGEHGVFLHSHHLYDEIIRAPLIMKAPHMSVRGAYNHYLFQSIDLMPTIVRFFGGNVPEGLGGTDMVSVLGNPNAVDPQRYVISEFFNFGISRRMIRSYEHKIIYQEPANEEEFLATVKQRRFLPSVSFDKETIELYDLRADPFERRDLYTPQLAKQPQWAKMLRLVRSYRSTIQKPSVKPVAEHLDPETYRDLKALGYIR